MLSRGAANRSPEAGNGSPNHLRAGGERGAGAAGGAGPVGTYLIGLILRTRLYSVLMALPLVLAAGAVALTVAGGSPVTVAPLLAVWGLTGKAAPVGWWTWLSEAPPRDAEAGGGLTVAVIQPAIASGGAASGLLYDMSGYRSTFAVSAAALCAPALLTAMGSREAAAKKTDPRATTATTAFLDPWRAYCHL